MIIIIILFICVLILYFSLIFIKYIDNNVSIEDRKIRKKIKKFKKLDDEIVRPKKKFTEKQLCKRYCDDKICCDYDKLLKNYNECKNCKEKRLCWDKDLLKCIKCNKMNNKSCDELYGCYDEEKEIYLPPKNPKNNFCKLC